MPENEETPPEFDMDGATYTPRRLTLREARDLLIHETETDVEGPAVIDKLVEQAQMILRDTSGNAPSVDQVLDSGMTAGDVGEAMSWAMGVDPD